MTDFVFSRRSPFFGEMEPDGGRARPGGHRSGSRRSGRGDRPSLTPTEVKLSSNEYSSSDEDAADGRGNTGGRGFLAPMKTGKGARGDLGGIWGEGG